jgi:hypothetical protein
LGAQNTTWCSKSVLAPPEPSCSNEGQQEKEKHWPGVRSPRAAGSYTVFLSSILLVFYVFSALMSMSKFHTHTHAFLIRGFVCICYAGPVKKLQNS